MHYPMKNIYNSFYEAAVVKDPIIEMNNSLPAPDNPPASPDVKGCRRAHQGLYNELVDVLRIKEIALKSLTILLSMALMLKLNKRLILFGLIKNI